MTRLDRRSLLAFVTLLGVGCGGGNASEGGFGSLDEDGSAGSGGLDEGTGDGTGDDGSDANPATMGDDGTAGDGTAGTDGDDSHGTDGEGSADEGNDEGATSQDDSDGDDTAGDTGDDGPGEVPSQMPEVLEGLCDTPGIVRYCYTGIPATYLTGECRPGVQQCVAQDLDFGKWSECDGETLPGAEVCDGEDNDCDGQVDEDGTVEECGVGPCLHSESTCIGGEANECDPFEGAQSEICDSIDNDCDGSTDEGLGDQTISCGIGACEHSVTACVAGEQPECDPFEGASSETCNGIDDDCDGPIDEGLEDQTCGQGECRHTVPTCFEGEAVVCNPYEGATSEVCDGLDNDCDGATDEDQGVWECGENDCAATSPKCVGGVPQSASTCQPQGGGAETCGDGEDNNCDGEAPPCAESFLVGTDTDTRPVDVIWAVDASGSMAQEMAKVEAEINLFANALVAAGSDTQLHLIADRGTGQFEICVAPPLGGANCADNAGEGFWQYDANASNGTFVNSSNALGRVMQQSGNWMQRLQENSHLVIIVTSDDNGDDPLWVAPNDLSTIDDCESTSFLADSTVTDLCRWRFTSTNPSIDRTYTSLANDISSVRGFLSFMSDFFPGTIAGVDWSFYSIVGSTGTRVLSGAEDVFEFDCTGDASGFGVIEASEEYVKLSEATDRLAEMRRICAGDWDLDGLAEDIVSGIPNDTFVLDGSPAGMCEFIDPATITVLINGIPRNPSDWTYDDFTCTLRIATNPPVVGDTVVIVYENVDLP